MFGRSLFGSTIVVGGGGGGSVAQDTSSWLNSFWGNRSPAVTGNSIVARRFSGGVLTLN